MNNDGSSVAIVSFSDIETDPRVLRQIGAFGSRWQLQIIGYGSQPAVMPPGAVFHSVPRMPRWRTALRGVLLLATGRLLPRVAYAVWYWRRPDVRRTRQILGGLRCCAIVANEWSALPVTLETAAENGSRVVCDLHEYSPAMGEDRWYWRFLYRRLIEHVLARYLPRIAGSMTVNESIAGRYRTEYGIDPLVVRNIPAVDPRPGSPRPLGDVIRLVHHGAAIRDRGLEGMIDTLGLLDRRYTLEFMLVPTQSRYFRSLKAYASRVCPGRITFRQPVRPAEIVSALSGYDIGLYVLRPSNYNNLVSLPNKIFEFMAAGLAVVTGPSPEMVRVIEQAGVGRAASDFSPTAVAALLNGLDRGTITAFKMAAAAANFREVHREEMQRAVELIERCCTEGSPG